MSITGPTRTRDDEQRYAARTVESSERAKPGASIAAVRLATPDEWDAAFTSTPSATYFQSRSWMEVWADYRGGRSQAFRVLFEDGHVAVIPALRASAAGGLSYRWWLSPAGTYGGWLSDPDLTDAHASALLAWKHQELKNVTWRANPFDPVQVRLARAVGDPDATQAIRLTDAALTPKRLSRGHQNSLQQAARNGVAVRPAETIDDWRTYFRIYECSLRRWGKDATSRYGWPLFEALAAESQVRLYLAYVDGRLAAGSLVGIAPRVWTVWHAANDYELRHARAGVALNWHLLRDATGAGADTFDFGPSGGHEGVVAFKRGFRCDNLPAPLVTTHTRLNHRLSHVGGWVRSQTCLPRGLA